MAFDPVSVLLDAGGKVIDRLWPDPVQAAQAKLELVKLQQSGELAVMTGQLQLDQAEATNPSKLVSGWRPFIGWVCGAACAWNWLGLKIALFIALACFGQDLNLAPADMSEMMPVLMGMLGLGGLHTFERIKGVGAQR